MTRPLRLVVVVVALVGGSLLIGTGASSAAPGKHRHKGVVGELVFSTAESRAICEEVMGEGPTWARSALTHGPELLPGGILLMGCSHDRLTDEPELLLAYDLLHRRVLWAKRVPVDEYSPLEYVNSAHHLFRFFSTVTPAHGLQPRATHHFVAAYSIKTGKFEWRALNPALGAASGDPYSYGEAIEGPSGAVGSPEQVVLSYLGTSAFDTATGKLLWSTPSEFYSIASGSYVGSDTVVAVGRDDNGNDELTGLDPVTEAVRWELHLPSECASRSAETVGTVEWQFGESCVFAYDLITGQPVLEDWFPSGWVRVAVNRSGVLEYGEGKLSFYSLGDLSTPVWSDNAGDTDPLFLGSTHAIVQSQAGTFILNLGDGKIAKRVPRGWSGDFIEGPVEGMVAKTSSNSADTVMRLDPR